MEHHLEIDKTESWETKKKKELCMNTKIHRNKHPRKNWKNKLKRRTKGSRWRANVEEKDQMVPNVNKVARELEQGPDD
ncbi:hypothetical protein MKX03_010628, partial [Papaver bracteatum]